jgi:8-oxo-dGTP diphosphatase
MSKLETTEKDAVELVFIVAGCVIEQDGKYLMVQERKQQVYGLWNLPSGRVNKGEPIEEAAVREVEEETGYDIELGEKLGVYHESSSRPIKHYYRAKIIGGDLQVRPGEVLDAKWLSFEEITKLNEDGLIRIDCVYDAISKSRGV